MIVPDVNLLLYANITNFRDHAAAKSWWEKVVTAEEVGLTSPAVYGFVRLATNPRIFDPPMSVDDALSRVERWLERRSVHFLLPGPRHLEIAFKLLRDIGTAGNLTTDVQLAAFALEYQAELHSNDSDFARFPGLRWFNPLGK
jgi:toxin-antitoxin system PIN domain toxin